MASKSLPLRASALPFPNQLTESELWQSIAGCVSELLRREDRLGVPLLRTCGERAEMEIDLCVRIENRPSSTD